METTPGSHTARAGWITPAILLGLVGVLALFTVEANTTWYGVFKLIHVVLSVFWVGGGILLTVLALRGERSENPDELAAVARQAAFVGEKLFAPAGAVVLVMGILMVHDGHLGFGTTWVTIGLTGWALSFIIGIAFLSPRSKRIVQLLATVGPAAPETKKAVRDILLIARLDVALLVIVVTDMVVQPFS